ncbi:phosphonate C-P lyase system protein PhnG [Shinella yambaruensis]|uniref:Alpha-D-ribose 1-methylphosphonate 5-triphosphate synthase subunit PhnG n=1 Tax=Shinella yambaruensis TaxID=415996 RepID=A0ABQ5ZGS1_9HYPH|nr:phosphonate C-P lyase system protein PhnG [Shinella yambaruensis]MCJ8024540.1 phosphonate C-P lyase system protein PhnG [Shinella yambaruensis]MCU7980525.1 phosphonate C-P lyase system protein PhnG [Shinella yambaruensis]GLR50821.1 alpha-D-ribose 1-methylphosphonate 5-triphosphate synthase subunit PhnG [Shinella yambaruensis]
MASIQKSAETAATGDRQRAMGLLAKASRAELQAAFDALDDKPAAQPVRGPETGLVMVRGRIGGGGAPFNLGEATVARASVRLDDGTVGHGQALGTDGAKARLAAIFDALFQQPARRAEVAALLDAVAARIAGEDAEKARQTAATRVDFFTMVRGED